jgi:acyl carrier protein
VAGLYAALLNLEQVGATDSFFDLGGNSLQAMRLIAMMDDELAVDVGAAAVFLAPTPRQLAAVLRADHGLQDAELGADGLDGLEQLADADA